MTISWPAGLPQGLIAGRTYKTVSPMIRTEMQSGRAKQRRRFSDVPTMATVQWLMKPTQAMAFEAWFRDALVDGTNWFSCPLLTPLGLEQRECRFAGMYTGPEFVSPELWKFTADIELRERPVLQPGWGGFPQFVSGMSIFDLAMNREWPAA